MSHPECFCRVPCSKPVGGSDLVQSDPNMFHVTVGLVSGQSESFSVSKSSNVGDLKLMAQKSFRQGSLKLVTADARVLVDSSQSLEAAGIQENDHLTAIPQKANISATKRNVEGGAFALWCTSDKVITWGSPQVVGALQSAAQGRSGDSEHRECLCCDLARWVGCDMG